MIRQVGNKPTVLSKSPSSDQGHSESESPEMLPIIPHCTEKLYAHNSTVSRSCQTQIRKLVCKLTGVSMKYYTFGLETR